MTNPRTTVLLLSLLAAGCSSGGGSSPRGTGAPLPEGLPMPDLTVDPAMLGGEPGFSGPYVTTEDRSATDCAVVEGCLLPGPRRVLKFNVGVENVGDGDLWVGDPTARPDLFVWSPCHQHYHYRDFAEYQLLSPSGVVATGRKQAFCLMDVQPYGAPVPANPLYDCGNQGISVGWEDVYDESLDCQWIDVTTVPPGNYQLSVTINVGHHLPDRLQAPHTVSVGVTIP